MPEEEQEPPEEGSEEEEAEEELAQWQGVGSSMVSEVNYSEGYIGVIFNSGSEESYAGTQAQFEELLTAPSIGAWMWENFGDELHRGRA